MNYADLIRFEPVDSVIQLREADETNEAKRLVETFVISDAMAERLIDLVFKHLRLDLLGDSKELLVVGNYGTDKSHLMALILAIAEHADLGSAVTLAAETGGLTSYPAMAEVVLPCEHVWQKTARQTKEELLTEFSDPARRVSDDFRIKLLHALKDLKTRNQDAYLELHDKAHRGSEDARKKAALNQRDFWLKQLCALDRGEIRPHHQLKSF